MAVIQQMRRVGAGACVMRDDDGLAGRLANAGSEAHRGEIGAHICGGGPAIRGMGGLGADRGDAQPVRPATQGGIKAGFGMGERQFGGGGLHCFGVHAGLSCWP